MFEHPEDTKERILTAAGEVFAEHGFGAATVREICTKAQANIAAINYHFRDKATLYSAVLQHSYMQALTKYPPDMGITPGDPPQRRLEAFVLAFLSRILDEGRPAWHAKLISREMFAPTHALEQVIESGIVPQFRMLTEIISELLQQPVQSLETKLCASSVIGQCLHYHHCRHVVCRIEPELTPTPESRKHLAQHITEFSLGGILFRRAPEQLLKELNR